MELSKFDRARDYILLDAGTEWAAYVTPSLLLREGKTAEAREAVKRMSQIPHYHRDLLDAVSGSGLPPNLTGWRRTRRPASLPILTLSWPTTREVSSPLAEKTPPPSTCSRPRLS